MTKFCVSQYFINLFDSSKNEFAINFFFFCNKYTFIYFCNKILTDFGKSRVELTSQTSKVPT